MKFVLLFPFGVMMKMARRKLLDQYPLSEEEKRKSMTKLKKEELTKKERTEEEEGKKHIQKTEMHKDDDADHEKLMMMRENQTWRSM